MNIFWVFSLVWSWVAIFYLCYRVRTLAKIIEGIKTPFNIDAEIDRIIQEEEQGE